MIRDEYAQVNVPMLPVVKGEVATTKQILAYTFLMLPVSLLLVYPLHVMGAVYAIAAIYLGGLFIHKAWTLNQEPADRQLARSTFKFSISYMMLLCVGMGIDSLPVTKNLIGNVGAYLSPYFASGWQFIASQICIG
jgi:protoheme IX farnesyltransferase